MIKLSTMKKIISFLLLLLFSVCLKAQYNISNIYSNHNDLNASRYLPSQLDLGTKTVQIGLNYYLWMGNNNFSYHDLNRAYQDDDINFLSANAQKNNLLGVGQDFQLAGVAFQHNNEGKHYCFGFSIVDKFGMNFRYTKNFLQLALKGNKQFAGQKVDLGPVTVNANYLREYVLSTALPVFGDDQYGLRFGGRLKLIQGLGNIYMPKGNASILTEQNGRYVAMDFDYGIYTSGLTEFSFVKSRGLGTGIDVGLTYFLNRKLEVSWSINDLGLINYSEDSRSYRKTGSGVYEGLVIDQLFGGTKENIDSTNAIIDADREEGIEYVVPLGTKMYFNAEYKFFRKRKSGSEATNSLFLTYVQGFNKQPGASTKPFVSMGYNHHLLPFLNLGILAAAGGYNKFALGAFFSLHLKETLKIGISSDNITALILPKSGTGIDLGANFSLAF